MKCQGFLLYPKTLNQCQKMRRSKKWNDTSADSFAASHLFPIFYPSSSLLYCDLMSQKSGLPLSAIHWKHTASEVSGANSGTAVSVDHILLRLRSCRAPSSMSG
ncbi:hypothetical protein BDFG_01938 [Blastomyces dermatitidis ATCC 26199]|nr:hypothetical protein BDFG_01938 [Blastomyces dermatitidis ATCC 26199]